MNQRVKSYLIDTVAAISFWWSTGTITLMFFAPSVVWNEPTYIGWSVAVVTQTTLLGRVAGKYLTWMRNKLGGQN